MNEQAARNTLLLRAFETSADDDRWTDADRSWANRVASEVSQTSHTTEPTAVSYTHLTLPTTPYV